MWTYYYNYINYDAIVTETLKYAVYTSAVKTLLTGILIVCIVLLVSRVLITRLYGLVAKQYKTCLHTWKLSYTVTFLDLAKQKYITISGIYSGVAPFSTALFYVP